jgi:4-amino-4-deoxy-L-arabinose transferase-like glycosyltransferase
VRSLGALGFWIAAAVGLVLRLGLFAAASREPQRRLYAPDSADYQTLAENLLAGHGFSRDTQPPFRPDILRTPAYPAMLAGLYVFTGPRPAAGVFAGVLLSCAAILLVRQAARAWAPGTSGNLAGAFVALDLGAAAYANFLLTEALFVVCLLTAFLWLGRSLRADRGGPAFAAGLSLGVAILCRPIAVGLPLLALLTRKWKLAASVLLGCVLVVGPWVLRNVVSAGFLGVSSVASVNLLYHRASAVSDARAGRPHETAATPADANDSAAVARMRREGVDVLRRNAWLLARLTLYGWLRTFGPDEDPLFALRGIRSDPSPWWLTRAEASHQPRAASLAENVIEGLFLITLYACAFSALRARAEPIRRTLWLAAASVVAYFLLVSGPEYYGRFRVPILPFVALAAEAGGTRLPRTA